MFSVAKSVVLSSAVLAGSLFTSAPQAQAQGFGMSFYSGGLGGYYNAPYMGGGYGGYGGYGGGYRGYYGPSVNYYRGGYGGYGGYGHHHHHHGGCRW